MELPFHIRCTPDLLVTQGRCVQCKAVHNIVEEKVHEHGVAVQKQCTTKHFLEFGRFRIASSTGGKSKAQIHAHPIPFFSKTCCTSSQELEKILYITGVSSQTAGAPAKMSGRNRWALRGFRRFVCLSKHNTDLRSSWSAGGGWCIKRLNVQLVQFFRIGRVDACKPSLNLPQSQTKATQLMTKR